MKQRRELEQASIDLDSSSHNLSERLLQAEKKGIQVLIDRLRLEVVEYDNLKQQRTPIQIGSIEHLAIGLIKARIAAIRESFSVNSPRNICPL